MTTRCVVCQSNHTSFAFKTGNYHGRTKINNHRYRLYHCHNCTSYFLNIKTSAEYYRQAYQENYYPATSKFIKILDQISFFIKKIHIETSLGFPNQIKILDIGCGRGDFLSFLPRHYQKFGLEINSHAANIAKKQKIQIYNSDIKHTKLPPNYFDCITLWHSLEHFDSPQDTLNKIFESLRPGGTVVMNTPNSQSLGFYLGKKNYFHLDSPRHLFIPNPKSLKKMLTQSGFHDIKSTPQVFEYPLDLFWSVSQHPLKSLIYLLYPLLKLFTAETITTTGFK